MIILTLFNDLHLSRIYPMKSCMYTTYLMMFTILAHILRSS